MQQASQSYPFVPMTAGSALPSMHGRGGQAPAPGQPAAPTILNGYQTRVISPARVIRGADVRRVPCESDAAPPALACISWAVGPLTFHGRLEAETTDDPVRRISITSPQAVGAVEARATPAEQELPRGRRLARHFSEGLLLDGADGVGPVMVYFRMFEVAPDGLDFVLYQTAMHELALHDGARDTGDDLRRLLREAGGFLGNAAGYLWDRPQSPLGLAMAEGGDGVSERRFLETVEVTMRQSMAHSAWLWRVYAPRLFVVYTSLPDEVDHRLLALASTDPRYATFRRWGYQLVDLAVGALIDAATPNDHLVFVSDHGLAPVTHEVKVAVALQDAGLLSLNDQGRIDASRTRVVPMRNCLIVNGTDWKDGIVRPEARAAVLQRALAAVQRIVDAETGRRVVTDTVSSAEEQHTMGFGGVNGADACFDLAPGYAVDESSPRGPIVTRRRLPKGDHNFLATRPEMQGILVGAGPRLPRGAQWRALRAIDVAPLVSDLLAIDPPAQATGASPLATKE